MKRIYNKYGAAIFDREDQKTIDQACEKLVKELWDFVETKDYCPRDLENYINKNFTVDFAYKILCRATKMRKSSK